MNIIINTLSISNDKGGVKTYLKNITESSVEQYNDTDFILLCSKSSYSIFKFLSDYDNVGFLLLPISTKNSFVRIFIEQFLLPFILIFKFSKTKNVLVTPSSIATIFSSIPQVLIVQSPLALKNIRDEMPTIMLREFSFFNKVYYDFLLPKSIDRSEMVVAVSRYLQKKLIDLKPERRKKIKVIYEGVDRNNFKKINDPESEDLYILFVSSLFRYKNADRLIEAFGQIHKSNEIPSNCRLKIIGKDPSGGEEFKRLKEIAINFGVLERVDFLGVVPYNEVATYYQNAFIFVYPSSVETFGLPPLEAMACGLPVAASNRMSVPEIVDDAGLIFDPDDISSIAKSIKTLFDDKPLYNKLRSKGYDRITTFNWQKAANSIHDECKELLKSTE